MTDLLRPMNWMEGSFALSRDGWTQEKPACPQPQLPKDSRDASVGQLVYYGEYGPYLIVQVDHAKDLIRIRKQDTGEEFDMVRSL